MSTPTANPTRQQLEELDFLLQRMLSLPANQQVTEIPPAPQAVAPPVYAAPAPVRSAFSSAPLPAPAAMPPMPAPRRKAEPPSGEHVWNVPLPSTTGPAVINPWPMGIESLTASATSTVSPRPVPPPPPAPVRLRVAPMTPLEPAPPPQRFRMEPHRPSPAVLEPVEAPLPFYLWPLGAVDRSIGGAFSALGAPGRWLGAGSGKVFFGWCGLAMITAAVVWGIVDYMGLTW